MRALAWRNERVKTYVPKEGEVKKKWFIIDAEGKVLGRVAVEAAKLLRGKHKPQYTPYLDCGDHVIIVNAEKAKVTGKKAEAKMYYRHSGYPGGISEYNYSRLLEKHPTRAMTLAVTGMLPHNRLGRKLAKHLRVYAGAEHNQQAQNPQPYQV
ncbi:MAG: 50S ribosomal protein L13 [Candidatus Hydrogenedentes bacterium]|nr:50S ribosomal protein L13 [Candidatus Hydrogenedentota bacterium]